VTKHGEFKQFLRKRNIACKDVLVLGSDGKITKYNSWLAKWQAQPPF
jgi:hypothetical protein